MILVHFLCFLSRSESIPLTTEFFNSIKESPNNKPVVLELWDPWCNHCAAFRPKWNQLANSSRYIENVVFSDVNCVDNKVFCKKISTAGYPQVVFFDPSRNTFIDYDGSMDIEGIEAFIQKQINFPLLFLESENDLIEYRQKTNISSLFVLEANGDDSLIDNKIQYIKETANAYRNTSTNFVSFFAVSNEKKVSFYVYRSFDHKFIYDGDWSQSSITQFVQNNHMPILPPITEKHFEDFQTSKQMCLVAFIEGPEQYRQVLKIVEDMTVSFQFYYIKYEKNDYFCRYVGVRQEKLPLLTVLDIARERWVFYEGGMTADNLNNWIMKFDPKEVSWRGPGIGAFSDLYSTFYTLYANGGLPFYIVIFCLVFLIFAVLYMIYDVINLFREDDIRKNV